jgi:hypothetical protein
VASRSGQPRKRHHEKNNVPERGGKDGPAGDSALNPAFLEESLNQEFSGQTGAAEDCAQAATDSLMETAPGNVECWQACGV